MRTMREPNSEPTQTEPPLKPTDEGPPATWIFAVSWSLVAFTLETVSSSEFATQSARSPYAMPVGPAPTVALAVTVFVAGSIP